MNLTFNVDYRTDWGETLYLCGNHPALGGGDPSKALPMNFTGNEKWQLFVNCDIPAGETIEYHYIVRNESGVERREWGQPHRITITPGISRCEIFDHWQDQPMDKPYYSSAFTECVNARQNRDAAANPLCGMMNLRVWAPMVSAGQVLALSGDIAALGSWDPAKAVVMSDAAFPEWSCNVSLRDFKAPFDYKFVILDKATGEVVAWEGRDNRRMGIVPEAADEALVIAGARFVNPLNPWRGAGVAIPVFSLRSDEDFGAGDFMDLKKLVDWAASTGQRVVQILPINDTTMTHTWTDSYPYNANSTFALHPMYLRPELIATLADKQRLRIAHGGRNRGQTLVGMGHPHVFGLTAVDPAAESPAAVGIGAVVHVAVAAKEALAAEGLDVDRHPVARPDGGHTGSDGLHHADHLVSDGDARNGPRHTPVFDMQIARADAAERHADQRIVRVLQTGHRLVEQLETPLFNIRAG